MLSGFAFGDFRLSNLSKTNVLIGKNGYGKSALLKECEGTLRPLAVVPL